MAASKMAPSNSAPNSPPLKTKRAAQKPKPKPEKIQPSSAAPSSPPESTQPLSQRFQTQLGIPLTQPRATAGPRLPATLANPKVRSLAASAAPFHRSASHPPLTQPTSPSQPKPSLVWPSLDSFSLLSPEEILARFTPIPRRRAPSATKKPATSGQALTTPETTQSTQPHSSQQPPDHRPPSPPPQPLSSTPVEKRNSKKNPSAQPRKRRRSSKSGPELTDAPSTQQSPPRPAAHPSPPLPKTHPQATNNTPSQPHAPSESTDHEPLQIKPIPRRPRSTKATNDSDRAAEQLQHHPAVPQLDGPVQTQTVQKKNKAKHAHVESPPPSRPKKRPRLSSHTVPRSGHPSIAPLTSPQPIDTFGNLVTQDAAGQTNPRSNDPPSSPISSEETSATSQAQPNARALTAARKSRSIARADRCPSRENSAVPISRVPHKSHAVAQNGAEETKTHGDPLDSSRATRTRKKTSKAVVNDQANVTPDRSQSSRTSGSRKSSPDSSSASDPEAGQHQKPSPAEAQHDLAEPRAKRAKSIRKSGGQAALGHHTQASSSTTNSDRTTSSQPSDQPMPARKPKDAGKASAFLHPDTTEAAEFQEPRGSSSPRSAGRPATEGGRRSESPVHPAHDRPVAGLLHSESETLSQIIRDHGPIATRMADRSNGSSRRSVSTDRNSFLKRQKNKAKMKAKRLQKRHQDFASEATTTPTHQTPVKSPLVAPPSLCPVPPRKVEPQVTAWPPLTQLPVQALPIQQEFPPNVPKHFGRWELSMPSAQDVPIAVLARMHQFLDEAVCAGFARPIFRDPTPTNSKLNSPRGTGYPDSALPITTLLPIDDTTEEPPSPNACRTTPLTSVNPFLGSVTTKTRENRPASPRNGSSKSFSSGSSSVSDDVNDTVMMALGLGDSVCDVFDTSLDKTQHPPAPSINHSPNGRALLDLQKEIMAPDPMPQLSTVSSNTNSSQSSPSRSSLNFDNPNSRHSKRSNGKVKKIDLSKKSPSPTKASPEESDSSSEDATESSDEDEDHRPFDQTTSPTRTKQKSPGQTTSKEESTRRARRSLPESKMNQVSPTMTSGSPDPLIPDEGTEIPTRIPTPEPVSSSGSSSGGDDNEIVKTCLSNTSKPHKSDSSSEDETESSDEDEETHPAHEAKIQTRPQENVAKSTAGRPKNTSIQRKGTTVQPKSSVQESRADRVAPTIKSASSKPPIPAKKAKILTPIQHPKTVSSSASSSDEGNDGSSSDSSSDDDDSDSSSDTEPSPSGKLASPVGSPRHDHNQAVAVNQKHHKNQVKLATKIAQPENEVTVQAPRSKSDTSSSVEKEEEDDDDEEMQGVEEGFAPPSAQRPTKLKQNDPRASSSSSSSEEEEEKEEKKSEKKEPPWSKPRSASAEIGSMMINSRDDPFVVSYCGRAPMTGRRKTLEAFKPNDFSVDSFNFSVPTHQKNPTLAESSDDDESSSSDEDDTDASHTQSSNLTKRKNNSSTTAHGLPAHKLAGSLPKHALTHPSSSSFQNKKKLSMAQIWAKEESKIINSKNNKR